MWASPKTQLLLAADRQDDLRRVADLHRRSRRSVDDVLDRPEAGTQVGWRPVIGRLLALVSRASLVSRS